MQGLPPEIQRAPLTAVSVEKMTNEDKVKRKRKRGSVTTGIIVVGILTILLGVFQLWGGGFKGGALGWAYVVLGGVEVLLAVIIRIIVRLRTESELPGNVSRDGSFEQATQPCIGCAKPVPEEASKCPFCDCKHPIQAAVARAEKQRLR